MPLPFFEALKLYKKDIVKDSAINHIQSIDRWIRTETISSVYKSVIMEFFARKNIKVLDFD